MILQPNRRTFLSAASITSLGLLTGCSAPSGETARAATDEIPGYLSLLGVQLYTVRDLFEADARGTLEALAEIGIKSCETAGLYDYSAADIRALEDAATLGQDRLYLGWIPEEERAPEKYRALAELLNARGEEAKAAGMMVGYHNHDFEFNEADETTGYDILLSETDPELVTMELDLYWVAHAGLDGAAILQATPDRFSAIHIKDRAADGEMASAGDGEIDFATLLPLAESLGATRFYIEHDNPADPLVSVGRSYSHLMA